MIGANSKQPPQLITPEEAVAISMRAGTTDEIYIAVAIAEEYERLNFAPNDKWYHIACLYATLYEAGRLQGIREERYRRKKALPLQA